MRKFIIAFLIKFFLILPHMSFANQGFMYKIRTIESTISKGYRNFYSNENSKKLAIGLGFAGILANSDIDMQIQDLYQGSFRSERTNNFSKAVKPFGEGMTTLPIYLSATLLGEITKDMQFGSAVGEWGERSTRTVLVGVPSMLLLQMALGASRPKETDSYWRPFNDNNGVSGHSFMGAIPFLTAANMTDNPLLDCSFYQGSTLTGLSRINDDNHYFSQAALGWWMARLAASSENGSINDDVVITPGIIQNSVGIIMILHF